MAYPQRTKEEAVARVMQGQRATEVAADLGIKPNTVRFWVSKHRRRLKGFRWDGRRRYAAIHRVLDGECQIEVAQDLGIPRSTLRSWMHRYRVGKARAHVSAERRADCIRLVDVGLLTRKQAAEFYGVSMTAVRHWTKHINFQPYGPKIPRALLAQRYERWELGDKWADVLDIARKIHARLRRPRPEREAVLAMVASGVTPTEAAQYHGVPAGTVYAWVCRSKRGPT